MEAKNKKICAKKILIDYIFIIAGCFFLAAGINNFLVPNKISTGGVTTIATVLLYVFGIRLSITNLVLNGLLFVIGYKSLGRYAAVLTASGMLLLSIFFEVTSLIPVFSGDILIATMTGGVLMGIGMGLVVRRGGSTGGSDFAGQILRKRLPHIPLATIVLVIDCVIVSIAGIVFRSFEVTFYSVLALAVCSVVADRILNIGEKAKTIEVFSKKSDEIAEVLLGDFDRGVTGFHCKGMYTGDEALTLFCAVKPRELPKCVREIKRIDPSAFIVIGDASEVLGEGFKQ